jgi:uncharacterized membrane protein
MSPLSIAGPAVLLLAAIVSEAGARGSLRRNRFFGIRTPSALRSDEAWVAGHRAATRPAWIGFAVSAVVGLAAWFEPSSWPIPLKYVVVLIFVLTLIVIFVAAGRAARATAGTDSR